MVLRNYFHNIYYAFVSLWNSLKLTFSTMFQQGNTVHYPFESLEFEGFRGKLVNYTADCISCNKCVVVCPVDCITLTASQREEFDPEVHKASTGHPLRLELETYDINMDKCMYCNLCTEVCPTDCLVMTNDIEYSSYDEADMTISFCEESATGMGRH